MEAMVSLVTVWTGRLLLHFLWALFLLCPEEGVLSLELLPSTSRVVLERNSTYSVVCSGWSDVTWALPGDDEGGVSYVEGVSIEDLGSSSVLRITNATWRQSGRYSCSDQDQTKALDLFVPGEEPSHWFVPSSVAVVMRSSLSAVVPCVVSDPDLAVELWERSGAGQTPVSPVRFDPALGFTAELNDSSYTCSAHRGQQRAESQVYYVFSTIGPSELQVSLLSSSLVLMVGDPLLVNCTVSDSESVFFSWDFPRKLHSDSQEIEPLMEFLPNQIRSFINISETTLQDSGIYVCSVEESLQRQKVQKSLNISVLAQGFVSLSRSWSGSEPGLVVALLHHTVSLSLRIQAFPAPNISWTITTATGSSTITTTTESISMTTAEPSVTTATRTTTASTTRLSQTRFLSALMLEEVQLNQTGSYVATVSNAFEEKEMEFLLEVRAPPRIRSLAEVGVASVMCVSEGAPPPKLTWFTCPAQLRCTDEGWRNVSDSNTSVKENSTEQHGLTVVQTRLTLTSLESVSSVRCEAKSTAGRRAWDLRLIPSSLLSQVKVLSAVLVLVVLAVIFLILLIVLWRKKPGLGLGWRLLDSPSPDGLQVSYCDPSELPYDSEWEIPSELIQLGPVLSSGTFGRVLEASVSDLIGPNSSTKAYVTTVKDGAALRSLLSDLKILLHVGPHLNLLNILGACTKDKGSLTVISEWCCHGDLGSYLKKHRQTFTTSPAHGQSESDGYMDMNSEGSQYVAMKQLRGLQQPDYEILHETSNTSEQQGALSGSEELSLSDLLGFCFQTANAMLFLSERNVVHRDLGARNVLVTDGKILKICDLGLGRDLKSRPEYQRRGNVYCPLKWMSPESIFLAVFSSHSDVWSFGVLLWEIFSLGELPYPDVPVNQFCSDLKKGRRLDKPDLAPDQMFSVMSSCWQKSPAVRPSFSSLLETLGKLLPPDFHQKFSAVSEEFVSSLPVAPPRRNEDQTRTEPGPDGDSAAAQVTVHLLGEEPQSPGPAHITDVTVETTGNAALDADDKDGAELSEEVRSAMTSPAQEESGV